MRVLDDQDPFDSGLSMLKVNELSPATQELVDNEIKRLLQVQDVVYVVIRWSVMHYICIPRIDYR